MCPNWIRILSRKTPSLPTSLISGVCPVLLFQVCRPSFTSGVCPVLLFLVYQPPFLIESFLFNHHVLLFLVCQHYVLISGVCPLPSSCPPIPSLPASLTSGVCPLRSSCPPTPIVCQPPLLLESVLFKSTVCQPPVSWGLSSSAIFKVVWL